MLSVPGKVLPLILLKRLQAITDPQLMEAQCRFRRGRGTVDQIWAMRQGVEKAIQDTSVSVLCSPHKSLYNSTVNCQAMVFIVIEYGCQWRNVKSSSTD